MSNSELKKLQQELKNVYMELCKEANVLPSDSKLEKLKKIDKIVKERQKPGQGLLSVIDKKDSKPHC